ncbi:MAG: hypothetical protein ACLF0G_00230 [Candidatus Brocadiia bacterium]
MSDGARAGANPLVVGVGGIGCELAAACQVPTTRLRLLDFATGGLDAYPPEATIRLGGEPEDTDDMDPQAMREAAQEAADRLADGVEGAVGLALLLGAVGGQTGAIVLPVLANELRDAECTTVVVAVEPLPFEGQARADLAAQALGELEFAVDLVLAVPNRALSELCDTAQPVEQALACLKRKIARSARLLLEALADRSSVGLQPAELRRSLAEAGRGAVGTGIGRSGKRVEEAIRDACANSFLTQESCQRASAAILHLRGGEDLSLSEVSSATDMVAHLVGQVPVQVGLSTDGEEGEVRAVLLVTGIQAPQLEGADAETPSAAEHHELSFYDGENLDIPAFIRRQAVGRLRR